MKNYEKLFEEILFTQDDIEKKCVELASWVNENYKDSKELILVGILKGSIPFMAQLMKSINVNHIIDFMTVSTFDGGVKTTGNVKMVMDLKKNIENKDVLIVEDIIDSGITLEWVLTQLKLRNPKSLKVLTLLNKPQGRKVKMKVDKFGFTVPNKFLVGFGLDIKGKLRHLPFIGIFDKKKLSKI